MTARLVEVSGPIRDYAWGMPGGIAHALGRPVTGALEAELWLGAHPSAPSAVVAADVEWGDLAVWEQQTGGRVPYLLKLLSAASPLSLQAHPAPDQAAAGFAREEAAGIPRDAPERNYRDPHAKPELIVALFDGFEALCGFRPRARTVAVIQELARAAADPAPFAEWERLLSGPDGVRAAFDWLLGRGPIVERLVTELTGIAAAEPLRFELTVRIAREYPADPGIAISLMLNHVILKAGEALWLPAGSIHAYLRGTGMELMGPSDNVLRGGMTPKHVDIPELSAVLDFGDAEASLLPPIRVSENTVAYRPRSLPSGAGVPFELLAVAGDDDVAVPGPSLGIVVAGEVAVTTGDESIRLGRGQSVFVTDAAVLTVRGEGRLFVATA